jgi:aminoglycoside/choline kinase family phosphotransferase
VLPIADVPELLTPEWLDDALEVGGHLDGAHVTAVDVRPLGTGQMCDSVRVSLTYDRSTDAPRTLVAKLPAADPTSRATALMLRNYEKEIRFYQQLAPTLTMRTPHVYHCDIDLATGAFVLLLEDMAPAGQGDQLEGCTPEVARVAVRELIGLHAPRWRDPALADLDWLGGDPESGRQMMLMLFPSLWDGFLDRYSDRLGAEVRDTGRVLIDNLEAYLTFASEPTTIIHGDYRLDNLLLGTTPGSTPIAVVDWQTCTLGPAGQDVAYFLGAGLRPEVRREVEGELVSDYHERLVGAGVSDLSWDRFEADYRTGTWAGLLMAIGASMMVVRTDRGDDMFMVMADRHARHVLDSGAVDMLTGS